MRFEEVPGISRAWIDLVTDTLGTAAPYDLPRFRETAELLRRVSGSGILPAGVFAVAANITPSLLGGPVSQLLQCLTAVKVAAELSARGFESVAVIGLRPSPSAPAFSPPLRLLDSRSGIRTLDSGSGAPDPEAPIDPERAQALIAEIREMGRGSFDPATLELLADSCSGTLRSSTARLMGRLLGEGNAVVPESEGALAALPVLVEVVDCDDLGGRPDFPGPPGGTGPVLWPRASATLLDARSRRTLDRYALDLGDLFAGEDAAVGAVLERMRTPVPGLLCGLRGEVLGAIPASDDRAGVEDRFLKFRASCRERMVYQLDKLHRQCLSALAVKEGAARRRVRRACNALAPGGRRQEQALGGIGIPLRFSLPGLDRLRERLDILSLEHQLIEMD